MNHNQNFTITAGDYTQIVAPVYTDSTNTTVESDLHTGLVEWHMKGLKGINLISKSTVNGITVNTPESGYIVVEIIEEDTAGLTSGDYYHIAEFTINGTKLGLFDGVMSIDNRAGGE